MNEAIIQLQETIAHQGRDITRLSDAVYAQQKEIAELRRELEKLKAFAKGDEGIRPVDQETPPPHY